MKKPKKKFAWSYSSLSSYETCPLKYKFRLDKTPTKPNKYLERGIAIHKLGEDYLKGKLRKVPKEYEKFKLQMEKLKKEKKARVDSELELAFTREWELTEWFGADTWFRCKLDVLTEAPVSDKEFATNGTVTRVIDFKTGRPRDGYQDQERINIMATMKAEPEVVKATMEFWYLDHGVVTPKNPKIYVRNNMLRGTVNEFTARAGRMENEKKFLPKKGAHCSYCDYSKRKGGPCKY